MRSSLVLGIILLLAPDARGQGHTQTFISPGVKFGYHWGEGVFAGLELSYSIRPVNSFGAAYGASVNLDLLRSAAVKVHIGLQAGTFVGVQIGPTMMKERGKPIEWGYSATVYGLVTFMPYYTYTDLFNRTMSESGLLLKIPLQVSGPPFGNLFKT